MAKKYEHTTEDAQMAKEPEAAYAMQDNCVHQLNVDIQDNEDAAWEEILLTKPGVNISAEELLKMGRECINTPTISAKDAIEHFISM